MPRKRLTLEHLVAAGAFNPANWRHRRALDESVGPLADPELEEARQLVVDLREASLRSTWLLSGWRNLRSSSRPKGPRGDVRFSGGLPNLGLWIHPRVCGWIQPGRDGFRCRERGYNRAL